MSSLFKVRLAVAMLFLLLVGCAKESDSASSSCKTQKKSHQGCCSSHGGFGNQCLAGEALYTGSGALICNDGSESPSCTRGKPVVEMLTEYERDISEVNATFD
ncbi:hypothetical protein [Bdellovibrio bacteriovorus]|uniref:hypothetical protein n=1 Tax=Bdellovibrio bacteriovorus TaxID=959 RepID=UPI0011871B5D|nr:hypothetical protein [Bdellovibrio bacteriovorus]